MTHCHLCHSKAGNLNNFLYNSDAVADYVVILDNDMEPHPKFLTSTLPLFFEKRSECPPGALDDDATAEGGERTTSGGGKKPAATGASPYSDAPSVNTLAFVQTPQCARHRRRLTRGLARSFPRAASGAVSSQFVPRAVLALPRA